MLDREASCTGAAETLPGTCKLPGSSKSHENYLSSGKEVVKPHWTLQGRDFT